MTEKGKLMKPDIHPRYQQVVFRDRSTGEMFLTRSTMGSVETIEFEGATYPVINVDITAASHPFWTGKNRAIDSEGRIQRFQRRYSRS